MHIWHFDASMVDTVECHSYDCEYRKDSCTCACTCKAPHIDADDSVVHLSTASDAWENKVNGAVPPMVENEHSDSLNHGNPQHLLDGGNRFDVIGNIGRYNRQRRYNYIAETQGTALPRDKLHSLVALAGLT
jgi:hypothetical protein